LIVAQANIEFDTSRGVISVGPSPEGSRPRLEYDMLEAQERPNRDIVTSLSELVSQIGDSVWDKQRLGKILSSWAHSRDATGWYDEALLQWGEARARPIVSFGPAIIVRKRIERGFIRLFYEIIDQRNSNLEIQIGIRRVVEIVGDRT